MIRHLLIQFRRPFILLLHLLLVAIAWTGAFMLRFDGWIPQNFMSLYLVALPIALIVKGLAVHHFHLTSGLWRYVGMNDLVRLLKATTVGSLVFVTLVIFVHGHAYSRSVFAIDYVLTVALFGAVRFGSRIYRESFNPLIRAEAGRRTLIIGAGDTGEMALRSLQHDFSGVYHVVGFLDDDPLKQGARIHDTPVLGALEQAREAVDDLQITDIVIAIPDADKGLIRHIVEECAAHNVNFHIMPTFRDLVSGRVVIQDLRQIKVEDLLGRDPVDLDHSVVTEDIEDQCVLVTGAGGSIGSELARQIAGFAPAKLVLLDAAESALFDIEQELRRAHADLSLVACVSDIKHADSLSSVFATHAPALVYHAAAYKHVPLMERHPDEAVLNNIKGTRNLVEAADKHGVKRFVMISTDKAVRPTSVMGATKRCAELLVTTAESETCEFVAVRFGNVLGSNGSVVPTFRRQIEAGGPVTVTHPDITRYFMTIPEAVELVLQAGTLGKGGEVFVLEMGDPIRILDLARNMIELSGLEVDRDIKIEFTGLRPGEKLHEELVAYGENVAPTSIPNVMVHNGSATHQSRASYYSKDVANLEKTAGDRELEKAREALWAVLCKYDPDAT